MQVLGICLALLVLGSAVALIVTRRRRRLEKMKPTNFEDKLQSMLDSGDIDPDVAGLSALLPREIKRKNLKLIEEIGKGAFGTVWKGLLDESVGTSTPEYLVAAKTVNIKPGAELSRDQVRAYLQPYFLL